MFLTDLSCFYNYLKGRISMIHITSCGHDSRHTKPCNIEHKNNLSDYLILLVKEKAWFYVNEKKVETRPNMVICFPPYSYIHYGCDQAGYNDDWIHMSLPKEETSLLPNDLHIPMAEPIYPYQFHRLSQYILSLSDVFRNPSPHSESIMDSYMRIFLMTLSDDIKQHVTRQYTHKYYPSFSQLRTKLYNNPAHKWTIQNMAASMLLSPSYFQHLYKDFFGCSCQQDIIQARLTLAKFYLANSEMSIQEISDFCGYECSVHFMRQFKKFVGITPTEYRLHAI